MLVGEVDRQKPIVVVSGGWDPPHVGHLRLIQAAANLGHVLVVVHSDAWLERKKGKRFMPLEERRELLEGIEGVWRTYIALDQENGGVEETLEEIRTMLPGHLLVFANGGDRITLPKPEALTCQRLGYIMAFNVGGEKVQASSALTRQWASS